MILAIITKLNIWRIASILAFVLFIAMRLIIRASKLVSNRYYRDFHADEMIKETDTANSHNKLYFTTGETKTYIPKYILAKTAYDKYIIANYAKKFTEIKFFIIEYNARKKVVGVLEVDERYTHEASRIICVDKKTAYVNIVVEEADNKLINSRVIMPLSLKNIRKYSLLTSLSTFFLSFSLRQVVAEGFGAIASLLVFTPLVNIPAIAPYIMNLENLSRLFLNDYFNLLIILGIFVLSILSYVFSVLGFKKRNKEKKNGKGGVIEYEFL